MKHIACFLATRQSMVDTVESRYIYEFGIAWHRSTPVDCEESLASRVVRRQVSLLAIPPNLTLHSLSPCSRNTKSRGHWIITPYLFPLRRRRLVGR